MEQNIDGVCIMCRISLKCFGRKSDGTPALEHPVSFTVAVVASGQHSLSMNVDCKHNTGSHGQRCKASHPDVEKEGSGVLCPYALDLPYAMEQKMIIGRMTIG